jgi:esterase
MKLNFRTLGEGNSTTPIIILHGVFGSSDNWQTVGKFLSERYKIYLVDQRNHGLSPHSDEFNYHAMAGDLIELMDNESISKAHLIGHSMGGKTAMSVACIFPARVQSLTVVDIAPKYYAPHHQNILAGFHSVNLDSINSRTEADSQMSKVISHPGIRQFLLKNLIRKGDYFTWKHNLTSIEKNIEAIGEGLSNDCHFEEGTLFIAGGQSGYIQFEDHAEIKSHFPNSEIVAVEGAGHWVHAEKPKELIEVIIEFLAR